MKALLISVVILILSVTNIKLSGQDLHYTHNSFVAPYINPAETGHFSGTIRLGGIYREQFSSFIQKPYRSPLLYMDSPISYGLRKNHWVGAGFVFFFDKSGDISLQNRGLYGSMSYHIGLDTKFNSVISAGITYGNIRRSTNSDNAIFQDQYIENKPSQDLNLINNFKRGYNDLGAGIKFRKLHGLFSELIVGLSILHLNKPKVEFEGGKSANNLAPRTNIYISNGWELNSQMAIIPAIYFSKYKNTNNTSVQCFWKYRLKSNDESKTKRIDPNKLTLQFGLGYRIQDAVQFLASSQYMNWNFGLSYDLTVSTASTFNNSFGAFELAITRILKFPGKPKINSEFHCPRF